MAGDGFRHLGLCTGYSWSVEFFRQIKSLNPEMNQGRVDAGEGKGGTYNSRNQKGTMEYLVSVKHKGNHDRKIRNYASIKKKKLEALTSAVLLNTEFIFFVY